MHALMRCFVCMHTGRAQLFVEARGGGEWGYYDGARIPALVEWLESGSDAEQELADVIHEAFEPATVSIFLLAFLQCGMW